MGQLESEDKLLYLYLFTNPLTNMLGVYEIQLRRVSFDTRLPLERVTEGLETLKSAGKADYIDGYVILPNFVKNQNYNTNMLKSAASDMVDLPLSVLESLFFRRVLEWFRRVPKRWETVRNIENELEIELEEEKESKKEKEREGEDKGTVPNGSGTVRDSSFTFDDFWEEYGKPVEETKTKELWDDLDETDREAIKEFLPKYKTYEPDPQFRKHPANFLKHRTWENEFIIEQVENGKTSSQRKIWYTFKEVREVVDAGKYDEEDFDVVHDKTDSKGNPMRKLKSKAS